MHDARAVANWLIARANEAGNPLTPLQVIKLVYFVHGFVLAFYRRPLFRQPVEAWPYGPVIADVYHALKQYRAGEIDHLIPGIADEEFDTKELDIMHQVYDLYAVLSGMRLSSLTHHENSPWDKTYKKLGRGAIIDQSLIEEHFRDLVGGEQQ